MTTTQMTPMQELIQMSKQLRAKAVLIRRHVRFLSEWDWDNVPGDWGERTYLTVDEYCSPGRLEISVHGPDAAKLMAGVRREFGGGKWDKDGNSYNFTLARTIRVDVNDTDVEVEISSPRDKVCRRVVVGTTTREVPAQPAVEAHTEEIEEVEWVCAPILDSDDDAGTAAS